MSSEPFNFMEIDGEYTLTAEAGFKREFFDLHHCKSTGDLLEAIVRYIIRIEGIDDASFDFDSESGMFVVRSSDEQSLRQAAAILSREINREQVLKEAMESEEVEKELGLSANISSAVSEIMSGASGNLSPEEFLEQFKKYFPD